jgi:hypothetical protein
MRQADRIAAATRTLALQRAGGRCELCDGPAVSVHHRRPKGAGGSSAADRHHVTNLLVVCGVDNRSGHHGQCHRHPERFDNGWLVRHGETLPADIPVLIVGERWVLLTDDGGYRDVAAPEVAA